MSTMFRSGARVALRTSQSSLAPARTGGRRYLTTEPPHLRSRSWRNSALRWGVAIGGLYYYNTSPVFAEHPQNNLLNPNVDAMVEEREDSILNELTASSRAKSQKDASILQSAIERTSEDVADQQHPQSHSVSSETMPAPEMEGAAELEEEAEGQAAFNPVTGEINWDCPCLGGMAYGPCGPEFREAFSCFVYSTQEPKGMDCIDKFQNMQTCFRAHPEHYKGELEDDERLDAELAQEKEDLEKEIAERRAAVEAQQAQSSGTPGMNEVSSSGTAAGAQKPGKEKSKSKKQKPISKTVSEAQSSPQPEAKTTSHTPEGYSQEKEFEHGVASQTVRQPQTTKVSAEAMPESESLVPKAAHDATDSSSGNTHSKAT